MLEYLLRKYPDFVKECKAGFWLGILTAEILIFIVLALKVIL